ncbi:hypothetical protein [Moorena sp. SIO3H5]|uniref:VMAP-C domain-containing protein n=1 Tax=Moorena sp. SIO3H5 TaxID=2607834 RepID=UPI0013BA31C3|nr:hypothetical protein [Moorena sp. SIO3H5]NEO73342.1 hypothetical protein [Moorena sp. SIO3H5]
MSTVKKLRIDILKQEFEKLEKDYRAVAQKKQRESNPQEQNNLNLQLQDIANQMEEIERKLDVLEEPQDDKKTLLKLLNPFENEIITYVQKAYQACSPEDWLNPVPDTLTGIVEDLEKMPQGRSKYTRIERWVGYLVTEVTDSKLPPSVSHQLREWSQQNIEGYSELLKEVENKPKSKNSYLMVVIHASNQSSVSKWNKAGKYFVEAWFMPNDGVLEFEQLSQPESFPETATTDEIQQLLKAFLEEIATKYLCSQLTIELFLPLDLLNRDIDACRIDDGWGYLVPIGCEYPVLVRSWERLLPIYGRHRGLWQEKWHFLQQLPGAACNGFVSGDDQDLNRLFFQLSQQNVIGLKLLKAPPTIGKGSVFAVILKAAIPVALWLRQNLSLNCQEQVDGLLCCCIHELPEAVKNKRLDAFQYPPDTHIGHHLSLLWEDPYRVPPSIEYSM